MIMAACDTCAGNMGIGLKLMKIGVVSDTHMSRNAKSLPQALVAEFRHVDQILHLGDWVSPEIYEMLVELAPVEGIAGNNDGL